MYGKEYLLVSSVQFELSILGQEVLDSLWVHFLLLLQTEEEVIHRDNWQYMQIAKTILWPFQVETKHYSVADLPHY